MFPSIAAIHNLHRINDDLAAMHPGETRDIRLMVGDGAAVSVHRHATDGEAMFRINDLSPSNGGYRFPRSLEATTCGVFYLLSK
jgi:hypothetical protein